VNIEQQQNLAWIIKHRPTTLSKVVGDEARLVQSFLDSGNLPHFLFYSRHPGTGKTTIAKALIKDLQTDYLEINGSDERGIDTIRDKIKYFVSTKNSVEGVKKIVFMDEMDSMTRIAQEALRNMMERFASNAIFILTANYFEKIIEPVKNRCEVIAFGQPPKDEIAVYIKGICTVENLEFDDEGVSELIDTYYPSIRKMVSVLQQLNTKGVIVTKDNIVGDSAQFRLLWLKLKDKHVLEVRKEILEFNYNPDDLLKFFFTQTYTDKTLSTTQIVKLSKVLRKVNYNFAVGADKRIEIVTSLFEIFGALV